MDYVLVHDIDITNGLLHTPLVQPYAKWEYDGLLVYSNSKQE